MDLNEILALIERVEEVCPPEYQVEIVPTDQKDDICLVIIHLPAISIPPEACTSDTEKLISANLKKFFEKHPSLKRLYLLEKQELHSLHYEKILPALKNSEHFRVIYCCGNQFVFYARTSGCFMVYVNMTDYLGLKIEDMEDYLYIGTYKNIDVLIGYLMSTSESL